MYKKSLICFLLLTFIVTYLMGLIVFLNGGLEEQNALANAIMFIPAIIAIIIWVIFHNKHSFRAFFKFRLGSWKSWLIYPTLMTMLIALTYSITFLLSPSQFLNGQEIAEIMSNLPTYIDGYPLAINVLTPLLLNTVLGTVLILPLFIGEELGWRGYLYPVLFSSLSKKGLVIGGIIWGLWHLPVLLMGHNYPDTPLLGMFMITLFCISMGIILFYAYIKSGSIIIPSLMHGVIKQMSSTITDLFIDQDVHNPLVFGPTGLIGIIIFTFIAVFLYRKI
ncbi:CPBP family intramembrane glutamic endopeptidase [Salicibibacter kimchii]|uniref:CPBP family intramembrane metalloprotease n=1 Tax=Salicibibacter kimchii TaxID=2099786 RepID=A0A345BUW5_9BACI|nr:CPBP family intramembrane glutamic endopeptidase [Salicibibacter kimchii]AXF54746.1 CPBP family intramembrane metalloprotease [Salicibibacter kimchii]